LYYLNDEKERRLRVLSHEKNPGETEESNVQAEGKACINEGKVLYSPFTYITIVSVKSPCFLCQRENLAKILCATV